MPFLRRILQRGSKSRSMCVSRKDQGLGSKEEYVLNYGSPLLDKMVQLSCGHLPLASCQLSFHYLKSQGFDRLMQDQFSFRKALCRVISTAPIRTDYLAIACRYVARSDEQKEGLISFFSTLTPAP